MENKSLYFWGLMERLAPLLLYMITTMVLARFLTPEDFGTIGVLAIFISVANVLLDAGLGGSLVKEKVINSIDCSSIFVFNIIVSTVLYIILFVSAPYIEIFYKLENLTLIVRLLSLVFVINAFGLIPKSLLIRNLKFRQLSLISILSVFIASIVSITIAILKGKVYSLIAYQLIQAIFSVISFYIISHYKISLTFNWNRFRKLFSFGFYTTIVTVIDTVYENILTSIMGKTMNIQQTGYFAQAKKIEEVSVSLFSQTINNVAFPILTKKRLDRCYIMKETNSIVTKAIRLLFPIFISLSLFSEIIITIIYGKQWVEASYYLSLLIYVGLFVFIENTYRTFIKSLLKVKGLLIITLAKRMIGFILIFSSILISSNILIYSFLLSSFIGCLMNIVYYSKLTKESLMSIIKEIINAAFPTLIYWVIVYIVQKCINSVFIQIYIAISLLCCYYFLMFSLYRNKVKK